MTRFFKILAASAAFFISLALLDAGLGRVKAATGDIVAWSNDQQQDVARLTQTQFLPGLTDSFDLGNSSLRWRNLTVANLTVGSQSSTGMTGMARQVAAANTTLANFSAPFVGVTNATATITLPVAPATGAIFVVKDETGTAGAAGNITVKASTGNIEGAASLSVSSAYGTAKVLYTGSVWETW